MSGKRAKPSPWRFVRAAPVVIVCVVVWVMAGLFLLLPGSGTDQAHDGGADPVPSSSVTEVPTDTDSSGVPSPASSSPESAIPGTPTSPASRTSPDGRAPEQTPADDLDLSDASASAPVSQPRPRPATDPTAPAPTESTPGPPVDNPGKKKGHHKRHGPPGDHP
jgi:cytoskeletal protein RodZ